MGKNLKKVLYILATLLVLIFIFYNSMQDGKDSANTSTAVLNYINNFMKSININFRLSGHIVRKTAHFVEFFVFGIFIMLTLDSFKEKSYASFGYPLFFCIFVPTIDEYIQTFSNGRGSSVKDVLLDFLGAITGVIIIYIIVFIQNKRRSKRFRYTMKY